MISFIWPRPADNFLTGIGGTESYTIGQTKELNARGIDAQIVVAEGGEKVDLQSIPGAPIVPLSPEETANLEIPVFVLVPSLMQTKNQSYVILHCPPPPDERGERDFYVQGVKNKKIITPSNYAAGLWAAYLNVPKETIGVAYPFADQAFGLVKRPPRMTGKTRVLLASRLHPDKGIYTFLAALHFEYLLPRDKYEFDVVAAAADTPEGKIIEPLLKAHPLLRVLPPARGPEEVAALMANYDILVMPSNAQFYHETFGMNSVEAQYAGTRVVASNDGGLPETDCGGLTLVEPDNAYDLALGIAATAKLPSLTDKEREKARAMYTVKESVDMLLSILK